MSKVPSESEFWEYFRMRQEFSSDDLECRFVELLLAEGSYKTIRREWSKGCGWRRGRPKKCYENAWNMVIKDQAQYVYVEGLAISHPVSPLNHAWVEDRNGLVIDPTWETGQEYLGLRLQPQVLFHAISETCRFGVLGYTDLTYRLLDDSEFRASALVAEWPGNASVRP